RPAHRRAEPDPYNPHRRRHRGEQRPRQPADRRQGDRGPGGAVMSEVVWTVDEARDHVLAAFEACRTSRGNAEAVADALVRAELDGIPSHGLSRVPANAAQARAGKVDGFATPEVSRPLPGTVRIDAATGFAYPALRAGLPVL